MGLDIYLTRYEDFHDSKRREDEYEEKAEANWTEAGEYDSLSDTEKEQVRAKNKKLALSLGLNECGSCEKTKTIELDSKQYPEHMFKIGYFRSSYNDSGLNRVLGNAIGVDLHDIFSANDQYEFQPDWKESLNLTQKTIENWQKHLEQTGGVFVSMHSYNTLYGSPKNWPIQSTEEAMKAYKEEVSIEKPFCSYSNRTGTFYRDEPLKVRAIITGVNKDIFTQAYIPCHFVVYDTEESDPEKNWYMQALKIVKETCEWVLSQPDKEKFWMRWSG